MGPSRLVHSPCRPDGRKASHLDHHSHLWDEWRLVLPFPRRLADHRIRQHVNENVLEDHRLRRFTVAVLGCVILDLCAAGKEVRLLLNTCPSPPSLLLLLPTDQGWERQESVVESPKKLLR